VLRDEGDRLTRVVVCSPREEYFLVSDLEEHNIAQVADRNLAVQQHDTIKSKIMEFGSEVIDIPELANHPNSVFTRDTALCSPHGYIQLRLGLESRRGEEEWMAHALDATGEPCVGTIRAPGTVEGGDVILTGSVAFVGRSIRTNDEGVRQLSALLIAMDYDVRTICVPDPILHLDKVLMVAGPNRVLSCSDWIPHESLKGFDVIGVSCGGRTTANIICLGNNEVIVERSNREVIERLDANGLIVHAVELSEFAKGTGGPNCLVMPVERKNSVERKMKIARAETESQISGICALFREYEQFLNVDLCFQEFEKELVELPGRYAPPDGELLVAEDEGQFAGCVGLRKIGDGICEMKRLFVRPQYRGLGLGRALAEKIIHQAKVRNYAMMRLDTLGFLERAMRLYESLGFKRTEPYYTNPLPGVVYWELDLAVKKKG